jgi:ATP-dependent protease ClpP protease subunit
VVNQTRQPWYQIRNAAKGDDGPAEVLIYDEIDSWFGVSAEALARDIAALDDDRALNVRINSPGGNIFDGVAILNALRGHPGKVTTIVDGLAASAASFIAMGGDEIVMNRDAEMMVHKGHGLVMGGADDMRKQAELIDRLNEKIAGIYADKAGGSVADWLAIMDAETWYSADEAVSAGLATRVDAAAGDRADVAAKFDLSMFHHAGRAHAPAPPIPMAHTDTSAESPAGAEKKEEPAMATLSETQLQKLGLDADADEAAIDTKIDELTAEREPVEQAEPSLEQALQVAAKAGLATNITTEALAGLQAQALAGAEARAQQVREADERVVDAAIVEGKIAPARRDHHLQALAADREGHTAVLAALQPGLVPLSEQGHGVTSEITNEDDAVYASLFGKDA